MEFDEEKLKKLLQNLQNSVSDFHPSEVRLKHRIHTVAKLLFQEKPYKKIPSLRFYTLLHSIYLNYLSLPKPLSIGIRFALAFSFVIMVGFVSFYLYDLVFIKPFYRSEQFSTYHTFSSDTIPLFPYPTYFILSFKSPPLLNFPVSHSQTTPLSLPKIDTLAISTIGHHHNTRAPFGFVNPIAFDTLILNKKISKLRAILKGFNLSLYFFDNYFCSDPFSVYHSVTRQTYFYRFVIQFSNRSLILALEQLPLPQNYYLFKILTDKTFNFLKISLINKLQKN